MKFEIKNRYSGALIISVEADNWKCAVELAIKQKANLSSADLRYANLSSANLRYANLRNADLRYAKLSSADLMTFQFQRDVAYFTTKEGALRIGCVFMPISEWLIGYQEIGKKNGYSDLQIEMYGDFIKMCAKIFEQSTKN